VLGFFCGLVGFAPVLFVRYQVKRGHSLARRHAISFGVASIGVSLVILIALLLLARHFAADTFTIFTIALIVTFLVANTGYAVWENRR